MTQSKQEFISIRWKSRPFTTQEYLNFTRGLLQLLEGFDPIFQNIIMASNVEDRYFDFKSDWSDFDSKVFHNLKISDDDIAYQNSDTDNISLTLASYSFMGFSTAYMPQGDMSKTYISISAGINDSRSNVVNLYFSREKAPCFNDLTFVRQLIITLINYCQPDYAMVISDSFWDALDGIESDGIDENGYVIQSDMRPVGWLTYIADGEVAAILPDNIQTERLGTGGVLITLQAQMPTAEQTEAVETARNIQKTIVAVNPEALAM